MFSNIFDIFIDKKALKTQRIILRGYYTINSTLE